MDDSMCLICYERYPDQAADDTVKEMYAQIVGFELPEHSKICYICSHHTKKFYNFRSFCIKNHLELLHHRKNGRERKSRRLLFNFTNSSMLGVVSYTCDEYSHEEGGLTEDRLYKNIKCEDQNNDEYLKDDCKSLISDDLNVRSIEIDKELTHIDDSCSDSKEMHQNDGRNSEDIDSASVSFKIEITEEIIKNESNSDAIENGEIVDESVRNLSTSDDDDITVGDAEVNFKKIILSVEEQKAELESMRKSKKFSEAQYKCYNCALSFPFKDSYKIHMVRHEESNGEYSCDVCGLRFAIGNVRRMHWAMHAERHECCRCGERVKRARRRQHAGRCGRAEPVTCHECANIYLDKTSLQQHIRRMHSKKQYRCNLCNKMYKSSSALRGHMIGTHSKAVFYCQKCSSHFSTPYALKQHMAGHSDRSALYCSACDKWYKNRKTYIVHLNSTAAHSNVSYECTECGGVCATRKLLDLHAQTHQAASHACVVCKKNYHTESSLKKHLRTHLGEQSTSTVQCHNCGKFIKGKSKLKRHLQTTCKVLGRCQEN